MSHICSDPIKTINIIRSSTFIRTLNITYNGNPLDITGATITFGIKDNPKNTEFIIEKTAVITDAVNGVAVITISATETNISEKTYYYDIKIAEISGRITLTGNQLFIITRGVQS